MPKMRRLVVCGLSETIATLPPQSALTSVDLPTFGRPATATNPLLIVSARTAYIPRACVSAASCGESQLEGVRQQRGRRSRNNLAVGAGVDHALQPKLDEPLPAAPARRSRNRNRLQLAGPAALRQRARECSLLRADAERVGGV